LAKERDRWTFLKEILTEAGNATAMSALSKTLDDKIKIESNSEWKEFYQRLKSVVDFAKDHPKIAQDAINGIIEKTKKK